MTQHQTVTLELCPSDRSFRSNLGLLSLSGAVVQWRVYKAGYKQIPDVATVENSGGLIVVKQNSPATEVLYAYNQIYLVVAVVRVAPLAKEHK